MNYDRIILELLDRVKKLETEVEMLKKGCITDSNDDKKGLSGFAMRNTWGGKSEKDTTKYIFNNVKYPKNRLVLAVVKKYVELNPKTTVMDLKKIFDASLQGTKSLGVVIDKNDAIKRHDYKRRFFTSPHEEIKLIDGICFVCTQWGSPNINNFIARAKQLGFEIIANN